MDQAHHGPGNRLAAHESSRRRNWSNTRSRRSASRPSRRPANRLDRDLHPFSSGDAQKFTAGTLIALDLDNTGQTGFVGAPFAGAYIRQPITDIDYIRRITFNVSLVAAVSAAGLTLATPLPGGAPPAGAKLQALTGFVDREGGSFYQEWSALFVMEGSQGERIFFHYPRLQSMASAEEASLPLAVKQGTQARFALKAHFLALPVTDPLDGERVLCYRSFLPAPNALI